MFSQNSKIDTVLLACTHYPLLQKKIRKYTEDRINIVSQGEIVAKSLIDYLKRHPEIGQFCSKNKKIIFYTTDSTELFDKNASIFYNANIHSHHINLEQD